MKVAEVSTLDELVSIAEGRGRGFYTGAIKACSLRIPMHLYAQSQALADMGKTSLNDVLSRLVEIGIDQVRDRLSDAAAERFTVLEAGHMGDESSTGTIGEGEA